MADNQGQKDDKGHRVYVTGARYGQELADRRKSEREALEGVGEQ